MDNNNAIEKVKDFCRTADGERLFNGFVFYHNNFNPCDFERCEQYEILKNEIISRCNRSTPNNISELAQRVINVDFFGARDAGATVESVAQDIIIDPLTIINYLLDVIDDLQA